VQAREGLSFGPVELPEPTAAFAVGAKARGEEEKVFEAIRRVTDEDPSLKLYRSEATGEDILAGLAQMHVELALERINRRYGVEVDAEAPKVPFMETITAGAKARGATRSRPAGAGSSGTRGSRSPRSPAARASSSRTR
jgi:elongation factor G